MPSEALAGFLVVPEWLCGIAVTDHPLVQEVARLVRRRCPRAPGGWMRRRVAELILVTHVKKAAVLDLKRD